MQGQHQVFNTLVWRWQSRLYNSDAFVIVEFRPAATFLSRSEPHHLLLKVAKSAIDAYSEVICRRYRKHCTIYRSANTDLQSWRRDW